MFRTLLPDTARVDVYIYIYRQVNTGLGGIAPNKGGCVIALRVTATRPAPLLSPTAAAETVHSFAADEDDMLAASASPSSPSASLSSAASGNSRLTAAGARGAEEVRTTTLVFSFVYHARDGDGGGVRRGWM